MNPLGIPATHWPPRPPEPPEPQPPRSPWLPEARPPVVTVPGRGEQGDDLDDVQVGPAQGSGPALSTSP